MTMLRFTDLSGIDRRPSASAVMCWSGTEESRDASNRDGIEALGSGTSGVDRTEFDEPTTACVVARSGLGQRPRVRPPRAAFGRVRAVMAMPTRTLVVAFVTLFVLVVGAPAIGQEEPTPGEISLTSPYVAVSVEPGETADLDLELSAPPGERVDLAVADLPEGWEARISGGGFIVGAVVADEDGPGLALEVDVPADAASGTYPVVVEATGESGSDRLDVELRVAEAVGGGITLEAEFPRLQGPSDVEFSYSLELVNDTQDEIEFGLQTQAPTGWLATARPAGESRAATVTVAAGETSRITVDVDPPDATGAGSYPVAVVAAGGDESVRAELIVEITGNFALGLTTIDERLDVEVEAGRATEYALVVVNEGTAPLRDVSLSATPPRNWDVEFAPESIPQIGPGESVEVTATITPASDAIAGDYRTTFSASSPETSDSIEVRTSVRTSGLWGLVGVGVIVVALGGLALVFRRFGRR